MQEVLERQTRLLDNTALCHKLPDRGEKARLTRDMVSKLLEEKEKVSGLEADLEKLKINTDKMEWKNRLLDSDDDSDPEQDGPARDPLAVLAQGVVPTKSTRAKATETSDTSADLELFAMRCVITRVDLNSVRYALTVLHQGG